MKTRHVKLIVVTFTSNPKYSAEVKIFRTGKGSYKLYSRVSMESLERLTEAVVEYLLCKQGTHVIPTSRGWKVRIPHA